MFSAVSRSMPGVGSLSTPDSLDVTSTRCALKSVMYVTNGSPANSSPKPLPTWIAYRPSWVSR
jgi:hypothetical protein